MKSIACFRHFSFIALVAFLHLPGQSAYAESSAPEPALNENPSDNRTGLPALSVPSTPDEATSTSSNSRPPSGPVIAFDSPPLVRPNGHDLDRVLRIVDKSSRAGDVALMALGALMGSFRTPVAKERLRGAEVGTVVHPARDGMAGGMAPAAVAWLADHKPEARPRNPMDLIPDTFALVFDEFSAETPVFELRIDTLIRRKPDSASFFSNGTQFTCSDVFDKPRLSLQEWAANDYEQVRLRKKEHIEHCVEQAKGKFAQLFAD